MTAGAWGIGVDSRIGAEQVVAMARLAEELSYSSFWFNVIGAEPDPLLLLAKVLGGTRRIEVGVGVVPLHLFPPEEVAERLRRNNIDAQRAILGLGSGAAQERPLRLVRTGLQMARSVSPQLRLAVGGSGTRMLELGATHADALVLSMMPFSRASFAHATISQTAETRSFHPSIYVYHRVTPDTVHGATLIEAEMISNGAWGAGDPPPSPEELLGTIGDDVSVNLNRYPSAWRPVLRPLIGPSSEADSLPKLLERFAPAAGTMPDRS